MNISQITSHILQSSDKARKLGEKYISGLVKEQLILLDYKKHFGDLNEELDDEEEIELEPEKIQLADLLPDDEEQPEEFDEPEDEEPEAIVEPEDIEIEDEPEQVDDFEDENEEEPIPPKKPEGDGYIRISKDEARELLSYKGKIFQAVFVKRSDGKIRAINGMVGVRRHTKGGELPYSPKDKGVIPVYDLKIGNGPAGYRMIPIEGLRTLHINGKKYKIDQSL